METQMYLTPSQVEELRELGVEFDVSYIQTYIIKRIDIEDALCFEASWREVIKMQQNNIPFDRYSPIRLQDVLDKLPKVIEVFYNEDYSGLYYLALSHICCDYWSVYYLKNSYKIEHLANYSNANPLLAALELLKWVAKNHPESLTKNQEQ